MTRSRNLYKGISIGNAWVEGNIFAAPLAGYTDRAFRSVCVENGADLCYTEMVSCEALYRGSKRTEEVLMQAQAERIYGVQIFAGNADVAGKAVKLLTQNHSPLLIDLNCGCPVPKIIKSGAGSALMRHPELIGHIVRAMKDNTELPVTVKIRTGWDQQSLNYLQAAESAARAGAALITMHARTRSQGYGGKADWSHFKRLKDALGNLPVLGSGDLFRPEDATRMLEDCGIDGVMLARGIIGNPFLFRETRHYLQTGNPLPGPSPLEKMKTAFHHLELAVRYKGESIAVREMKKQLCAYTKGLPGSSDIRNKLVHAEDFKTLKVLFTDYWEGLQDFDNGSR